MVPETYDFLMKLLLIGDSNVGKSCLLMRFCDKEYTPTYISTIGIDFRIHRMDIDNKKIKAQIWDTAGQERFKTITTAYFRGVHGILLVYDVTNRSSFYNVSNWIRQLKEHATDNVNILLIGNKSDLTSEREVSYQEGQDKANIIGCNFIETSAKSGTNVETAFKDTIRSIYNNFEKSNNSILDLNENIILDSNHKNTNICC